MAQVPIKVPFCKPDYAVNETGHLNAAIAEGRLEGGGRFTRASEAFLETMLGAKAALVVPSCTAALEMMGLVLDLKPGDEVIMPSFTFVSTANAMALRGAVPVFVDIDPNTLNIDPVAAEAAIGPRTRAIMLVHYAGVGCDMDAFEALSRKHDLVLLEDAAQALEASWNGRPLGSFGTYAAISFHHTKNVSCGEGGAFISNHGGDARLAEFVRDKGTNRADFLRGTESKYEWLSLGSSYLLSELAGAVLLGQLERSGDLLAKRLRLWARYQEAFAGRDDVIVPRIPPSAGHNAHIFHLRLCDREARDGFCQAMRERGVVASPHYVPLHLTPAGRQLGRAVGCMDITVRTTETLVRLPLFSAMTDSQQAFVIETALALLDGGRG
ncbi:dTDP-4-amino-4,6-dideoxygalactose transaminase [Maricaulis sp.]|uniref:dTDP-4-amino-4,6-dideoxygalactose transaminase n=1 Tax=Maricaulis sp. TaxID=1486257 RepID=UPI001B109F5B|nr:dTDP-4-amino-4,6-dideoxygalactose transaminase [Maricaulis sp.]MBO6797755.1 dTDP-4-amino-4,6-dideoxygalactose transaminase [Maricaulis sp.]